ncbi:MAG: hypothetical protein GX579_21515 [Chloroflexi bacterium]|nr:hypothetical protein [Chloroflexota bacterium]
MKDPFRGQQNTNQNSDNQIEEDDFDDALPLTALPFHSALYTGYTTHSPDDPPYPGCDETVWYRYTPQRRVELDVDTAGSDASFHSRLRLTLHGGETYYLMVCSHLAEIPYNLHLRVAPILYSYFPLLNRPVVNAE